MNSNDADGWIYKGRHNIFKKILKELPKAKIEILADDPKDQKTADQMSALVNYSYGKTVEITGPVVCNDGTKFEDYTWEDHLRYMGYGVEKDE